MNSSTSPRLRDATPEESGSNRIFSSRLRREARRKLGLHGMTVLVLGDDPRDAALFADVAAVSVLAPDAPLASSPLAAADVVICGTNWAAALRDALTGSAAAAAGTIAVAVRGDMEELDAATFAAVADLCEALGHELASVQMLPRDYQRDRQAFLLLAKPRHAIGSNAPALLKTALVLEAFSLQESAVACMNDYNFLTPNEEDRIRAEDIDRIYEVQPGATQEFTVSGSLESAAEGNSGSRLPHSPRLSIHFDLLQRTDGLGLLERLATSLVRPSDVEIVVRIPSAELVEGVRERARLFQSSGATLKLLRAGPQPTSPEPDGFLAETSPQAHIIAYYAADAVPVDAGWDHDLIRLAESIEGPVFALKCSRHKTRYLVSPLDALTAREGFPVVSRAWLEACRSWAPSGLSPAVFQTLVAFYLDRIDWIDKHRFMRLFPVTTIRTAPLDPEPLRSVATDRGRLSIPTEAEEEAIRTALELFAREWSSRAGIAAPRFQYDLQRRTLALRPDITGGPSPSWTLEPVRTRLPL
jgi:hypothetical protein